MTRAIAKGEKERKNANGRYQVRARDNVPKRGARDDFTFLDLSLLSGAIEH